MYQVNDQQVTHTQIKQAFDTNKAVIVCGWGGDGIARTLHLKLDGQHFDHRGECYSMWEETWTVKPRTLGQCLSVALTPNYVTA